MNRLFGVPASDGAGRVKAGHRTSYAPQSGSRSQCTATKSCGLSMKRRRPRQVLECASLLALWLWRRADRKRHRTGALQDATARSPGSWSNACGKNERGLSMNHTNSARALPLKAAEVRRTPRRWRVGHSRAHFRQVLECAGPAALWIDQTDSWSQCAASKSCRLSMNRPGHRIVAWLGKAALKTHALQTLRDCRASPKRAKRL